LVFQYLLGFARQVTANRLGIAGEPSGVQPYGFNALLDGAFRSGAMVLLQK
jgi:hypothetical protein